MHTDDHGYNLGVTIYFNGNGLGKSTVINVVFSDFSNGIAMHYYLGNSQKRLLL